MTTLSKIQRVKVNDVVFTFTRMVRNPQRVYAHQWPFFFTDWHVHLGDPETSKFGTRTREDFRSFTTYSDRYYRGLYGHYLALLRSLELYTATWEVLHFDYANHLFQKYYGVEQHG